MPSARHRVAQPQRSLGLSSLNTGGGRAREASLDGGSGPRQQLAANKAGGVLQPVRARQRHMRAGADICIYIYVSISIYIYIYI